MVHNVILPFIAFLSGVVSLFIDPRKDKAKAGVVVLVLVISAAATGVSGFRDDQQRVADQQKADDYEKVLLGQVQSLNDLVTRLLQSLGYSQTTAAATVEKEKGGAPTQKLQQSLAADAARSQILQQVRTTTVAHPQQTPVIKYFPKDVDGEVVSRALQEGGFKFEVATAQVPGVPTNSVWVGDSVTLDQAKFAALTLVRAGVQLRAIRRFRNGGGAKALLIEVGSDRDVLNNPVLTVQQIQNMTELPPRDMR